MLWGFAENLGAEFQTKVLHRALDDVELDFVILSEDMAYKNGPMIGPEAVREFMGEAYRKSWVSLKNMAWRF